MEQIIRHVFANFAVIQTSFVDLKRTNSLKSKEFLLEEKLRFQGDNGVIINDIWGCQISLDKQELRVLLGDCSSIIDTKEYCLIVQLKDNPTYGLYLIESQEVENEPLLSVSLNGLDWMECQTYLQATFLAAMEQVREAGLAWNKCTNYQENYKSLLSFIEFHNTVYEAGYEGQEDRSSFSK